MILFPYLENEDPAASRDGAAGSFLSVPGERRSLFTRNSR